MRAFAPIPLALMALSTPVMAQDQDSEVEALRAQVAHLTSQLAELSSRLDELEDENEEAAAQPVQAAPINAAAAPSHTPPVQVSMAATPGVETSSGITFKPFGRLMVDAGTTSLPNTLGLDEGFGQEIRRARLGVAGDIPGDFGYKMEVDFAGNELTITDAILSYETGGTELSIGQHNAFQSLEELTSSRFTSFIERAAFTDAFGFDRRLGLSAQYGTGDVLVQAGVFTSNIDTLPDDSWSIDGRAVFFPELGDAQLHIGGSLHYRELESDSSVRYRQRPLVHFTSERLINTGNIGATSEFGAGLEFAAIRGPLHFAAEAYRQDVSRGSGLDDVVFHGGYVEAGFFLTPRDSRGYKGGRFNRTRPANPVGEGGIGSVQVNLRYDYLDLNDGDVATGGIAGGQQNGFLASLIWTTTDYTRFQLNYGKLEYDDAVLTLPGGSREYSADALGVRAEFDF